MTRHRLVIVPWLRIPGRLLLRDWLAITLGGTILAWRTLTAAELEHELEHVRQWRRLGFLFPVAYIAEALRAKRSGKRWYHDNRFEADARKAASRLERA
ncbi:MAG TPA: hypothetical protein VMP86_07230 [Candidatus Binatia bacterium]|nr:hypothetical protein [Candidatus Binatia bacterium]